jgi:hypothetical protein
MFTGLSKLKTNGHVCACMLCFKNEKASLSKCLFPMHKYSPSNLVKHIIRLHKSDEAPEVLVSVSSGLGKAACVQSGVDSVARSADVNTLPGYFNTLTSQEAFELWGRKMHKFLTDVVYRFKVLRLRSSER